MHPLSILLLSDGRPGHYHLSDGIVAAMRRRRVVTCTRCDVRRRRVLPSRMLARTAAFGLPPARLLALGYGLSADDLPPADVVVSAGGDTLGANVAIARLLGVPNIFYGSLRAWRATDFALVLTSYAAQAAHPHPVMTLKPSALDPDALAASHGDGRAPARTIGVLVGGNGSGVVFDDGDWRDLLDLMQALQTHEDVRLIVADAPRTPAATSDQLAACLADDPDAQFIDYRTSGPGTLGPLLAQADLVLCTADSSSMLSEAIWARRPVVVLRPKRSDLPVQEAAYRAHLETGGYCRVVALAGLSPDTVWAMSAQIAPLARNPLDALESVIAERIPGLLD